jgi:hypothetical protein
MRSVRPYVCSVRVCETLPPILMAILLYPYKQLTECISEVEQIEIRVNSKKRRELTKEEVPTTIDSLFINKAQRS